MSVIGQRLDDILAEQVCQHTSRRVQELTVEIVGEKVVVRGRTRSYHVKQLATAGVRVVLPDAPLKNDIMVE